MGMIQQATKNLNRDVSNSLLIRDSERPVDFTTKLSNNKNNF